MTSYSFINPAKRQHAMIMLTLLVILSLLVYYLETTLVTDEMLYQSMITQFDHDTAMEQIEQFNKTGFVLLKYAWLFVYTVMKPVVITLIFMTGFFAFNIRISFAEIFQAVLPSCFVFLIPDVLRVTWFSLIQPNYQLADLNSFPSFSLTELFTAFDWTTGEDLKRLLKPINIVNLLFCWVVAKRLMEINPNEKNILKSVFILYFSVLLAFRLTVHLVATFIAP